MSFAPVPESLTIALRLPGKFWPTREVDEAFRWVFGTSLHAMLRNAARVLVEQPIAGRSRDEIAKDAEDACQDFAYKRFHKVLVRYNPDHPEHKSFETWVLFCFRRWCRARARVLRRYAMRMQPQAVLDMDRHPSSNGNPELALRKTQERRALTQAIEQAMTTIPDPRTRKLLGMQFWAETTVAERAATTGISEGAAKVRVHRALKTLAPRLTETARAAGFGGSR